MAARRAPLSRLAEVHADAWSTVLGVLQQLADADLDEPTPLVGWTVGDLVAHLGLGAAATADLVPSGEPPLSLSSYLDAYAPHAAEIDVRTRGSRADTASAAVAAVAAHREAAEAVLGELVGSGVAVVRARRGPVRLDDFVTTRVVELVCHADDLGRALPALVLDRSRPAGRPATQLAARALTEVLAERVPGHSLEVRVPPFAAVQCVPGPRHTRGTPPAVVELDPVTWLRLACGRLGWAEAVSDGRVRASGERADLAPHLPLLA